MTSLAAKASLDHAVTLSSVHQNLGRELERLYFETIALQAAIGPELSQLKCNSSALLSLQALDAHAQILAELSRVALAMGQGGATGNVDMQALFCTNILQSTAETIFDPRSSKSQPTQTPGEVTFF